MAQKHEVDRTTQASLLAPQSPAALILGAVVETEGGYYQAPKSEPAPPTPEQIALQDEDRALDFLDLANTSRHNIASMTAHQTALKAGKVKPGADIDIPTELRRLAGEPDDSDGPKGAIGSAQERLDYFRREAKKSFAQSIGIATITEEVERPVEGTPKTVKVVYAEDPDRQAELTRRYKAFYDQYGQPGDQVTAARAVRRQEISEQLKPQTAA